MPGPARPESEQGWIQQLTPALGASVPMIVVLVAVLSIPLGAARELGLSPGQLSAWIFAIYGIPALASIVLVLRYRQPLLLTGNIAIIILAASLSGEMAFAEIMGGAVFAGAVVAILGATRLVAGIARWFPFPIVLGLLAGIVLPFVVGIFDQLARAPVLVGVTIAVYLLSMRLLPPAFPPVLAAAVAGVLVAVLTGQVGDSQASAAFAMPVLTVPEFSLRALVTVTPVAAVLMMLQANIPSIVYLRSEGYRPPERAMWAASGLGAFVGSFLAPTGVSFSVLAMPFTAGPRAGEKARRHWTVYIVAAAALLTAAGGAAAAAAVELVPVPFILAIAGLAMIGVLTDSIREIVRGPLLIGPLVTLAIAISDLQLLGLGALFWALLIGTATSVLVEPEGMKALVGEQEPTA